MKTLADFKRKAILGSKWHCNYHRKFEGRNPDTGEVIFIDSYFQYPKASEVKFVGEDTIQVFREGKKLLTFTFLSNPDFISGDDGGYVLTGINKMTVNGSTYNWSSDKNGWYRAIETKFNHEPKEVTENEMDDMLNCMPPIYVSTVDGIVVEAGFAVSEPISSHNGQPTFAVYFKMDGKCYRCECWLNGVLDSNYDNLRYTRGNMAHTVTPYVSGTGQESIVSEPDVQYTQGKWQVRKVVNDLEIYEEDSQKDLALVYQVSRGRTEDEARATASVMAAAPKLLAALEMFMDATSSQGSNPKRVTINVQLHTSAMQFAKEAIREAKY